MKEFTFYWWQSDDEGGYAICRTEEFSPKRNFQPESGWRARPSVKVGEFNTVEELGEIIYNENKGQFSQEECYVDAQMYFHWYLEDLED
jgi:hypothetical protein